MHALIRIAFGVLTMVLAFAASAQSPPPQKGPSDLYFLAVGAANHMDPDFDALDASNASATLVANALITAGARHGILLTSSPGENRFITRDDVYGALFKLKQRIRRDGSRAPRVLVYIMTHGAGDPTSDYLFLVPDNLVVGENPVKQEHVFRYGKRAVFNLDLLATLMNFRLDPRLAHFDDRFESDLFSDKPRLRGLNEHRLNLAAREREIARIAQGYGSAPFDNAPVPFMLLLDNCTDGVTPNLVRPNRAMKRLTGATYRATLDVGRAFYAVEPGLVASPLALPDALTDEKDKVRSVVGTMVPPIVGPLAVHLKSVLANRDPARPMSLASFADAFARSGGPDPTGIMPKRAFAPTAPLRRDVGSADFLPAVSGRTGTVERIAPTGRRPVACCEVID